MTTGTSTVFTAVNGFGSGPLKASSYVYVWNTTAGEPGSWAGASQWTSGSLTETPSADGSYYLHLRACNQDGVANPATLTLGPYVYETATSVATISDAWAFADGVPISLTGKAVTAAFAGDSFWIEEANRSAGMRVAYASTSGAWKDRLVTVVGVLDSAQKPRTLVASSVQDVGPASPPIAPLEMILRGVGGSAFNANTLGITNGSGLYNIGLLAAVAGQVSFADNTTDPNNRYFFVNDGSPLAVSGGHPGIKVKCGANAAPTSGMVVVVGVVERGIVARWGRAGADHTRKRRHFACAVVNDDSLSSRENVMRIARGLIVAVLIVVLAGLCVPAGAQAYYWLTLGGSAGGSVSQSGTGFYTAGEVVTASASPDGGYTFWEWRDEAGNSVSTDRYYTFYMPAANVTLNAVFVQNGVWVHAAVDPAAGGSAGGAGVYTAGTTCRLTAAPALGYAFVRWTTDQAGSNPVTTANPYSFTVASTTSLYAQFESALYTLTRSSCGGGTVSGPSGPIQTGTQVTLTATPDPGYWFAGWATNSCGGTVVSLNKTYTFNMPPSSYDVHATFKTAELVETFETRDTGGASFDSLDSNDAVGPNQAANGGGNPWWGYLPPNGRINPYLAHSGSNAMWGTAGTCRDFCNIQTRCGGGGPIEGDIYLDWWFYDPLGSGGNSTNFCNDFMALSYYSGVSADMDYAGQTPAQIGALIQQLAVGMSGDYTIGYDPTRYQVRIVGDPSGYHDGWFNTSVVRSVGWHHARILVGPRRSPSNTNDITFYVDSMDTPVFSPRDSVTTVGFNIIEINTIMPKSGTCGSPDGCQYSKYLHFSAVDDISLSSIPSAPTAGVASDVTTNSITWNWTAHAPYGDGFKFWNSSSLGDLIGAVNASATSFTETGLEANVRYMRWMGAYADRYAGMLESARATLPVTCTLTLPPVYGASGTGAIRCNNGPGSTTARYTLGTTMTFLAVSGFGTGPGKVGKYIYFWDNSPDEPAGWTGASEWTSSALRKTPGVDGWYYLHLRGCNLDGVVDPVTLNLGPYIYETATPIARISDAWPYDDNVSLTLTGKPVTAAFSADSFWIEEPDRSAGMRVSYALTSSLWLDHLVTVTGSLDSTQKPRTLVATSVQDLGAASPKIAPLGMTLREVGGSDFNAKTSSITGGAGLYNTGLLVSVAGQVSFADNSDPNNRFFYINDGSALALAGLHPGVKVKCGTSAAPTSGMVSVTGVISMESATGGYAPVLIIRGAGDIVPVP